MVVVSALGCRPVVALLRPALGEPINCTFGPSRSLKFAPRSRKFSSLVAASMGSPPPGYRRNVGICLINSDNKIFLASRLGIPGAWQMPQGGVDGEEDPRIAAFRELKEEAGVISADILAEVNTYTLDSVAESVISFRFLFRFTGKEEEINLAGDGNEKPEFAEWAWMTPAQVIELAVDFKKSVYDEVLKVFRPHFL